MEIHVPLAGMTLTKSWQKCFFFFFVVEITEASLRHGKQVVLCVCEIVMLSYFCHNMNPPDKLFQTTVVLRIYDLSWIPFSAVFFVRGGGYIFTLLKLWIQGSQYGQNVSHGNNGFRPHFSLEEIRFRTFGVFYPYPFICIWKEVSILFGPNLVHL